MSTAKLNRTTFTTSRLLEFCSEKELVAQTGHGTYEWPLVVLKELLDNALDACEEAGIAPIIKVTVDDAGITVSDNGPGLPTKTIDKILDYSIRVSSREAYVAPDRGAQGNALKTLIAMPFVLSEDDERGRVDITTPDGRHEIVFSVDPIRQEPKIERTVHADQNVKNGTVFAIHWPDVASDIVTDRKDEFLQLASDFTFTNPHLTLTVDWFEQTSTVEATNTDWKKWGPSDPTSPHWYQPDDFERLLAAYIAYDQDRDADRYVRDVVKEFRGLSGSAKQKIVLESVDMARTRLSSLANGDGMKHTITADLLKAMISHSKEVKPSVLGVIGKDHLEKRFIETGCDKKTFNYRKILDVDEGIPVVVETAFALMEDENECRRIVTGVNWSGAIGNPFSSLGDDYRDGLVALLEKQMAGHREPIVLFLHCACARVRYKDRGKSSIVVN